MKVSFYPRGAMIQARISDGPKINYRLSTGIKVPTHLKFSKGRFIGNNAESNSLNVELDRQKVELKELYLKFGKLEPIKNAFNNNMIKVVEDVELGDFNLLRLIKEYLKLAQQGKIITNKKKPLTEGSIGVYANAGNTLAEYCSIKGQIDLADYFITPNMDPYKRKEIRDALQSKFSDFDRYMSRMGLIFNTRCNYLNHISVMLSYWVKELSLTIPKLSFQPPKENPIVVLDSDFISDFISDRFNIYDTLTDQLKYVWEVSTTILFTTLRIQDAVDLEWKDFQVVKDKMYMVKFNKKVGMSQAPLPKKLADIYRMNMAKYGRIYTMKKDRKFLGRYMHTLFALYEPMHEFVNIRKFGILGEEVCETKRFYEAIHPHMLRKSAITNMLLNGLDERTIKNLSGHSEKSKSFERYVGFSQTHFNDKLEDYYSKISQ